MSEDISPDPGSTLEGGQIQFSKLETWSDGCTVDTTGDGSWGIAASSCDSSGTIDAAGLYTAGDALCGGGCSEDVSADATNSPVTVTVDNDDTVTSDDMAPLSSTVSEGGTVQFSLTRTWSDGCTEDITTGAGWTITVSDCSTAGSIDPDSGLYTAASSVSADCTENVDSTNPASDNGPGTVNVQAGAATCDTIAVVPGTTVTLAEGSTQNFTLTCTYSDSSTDDCTAVGGATWSTSGDVILLADNDTNADVQADDVPCSLGGSGAVTAQNSECSVDSSDSTDIDVTNDDVCALEIYDPGTAVSSSTDQYVASIDTADTPSGQGECIADAQGEEDPAAAFNYTCGNNSYFADRNDVMHFDSMDVTGIPDGATITGVVLEASWYAEGGYGGTNCLEWATDENTFVNTAICPSNVQAWNDEAEDITADRTWTKSMISTMDVRYTNNDGPPPDGVAWDYVRVHVSYESLGSRTLITAIFEGETTDYLAWENCDDGCSTDLTAGSTITGDGTGGNGFMQGDEVPCGDDPAGAIFVQAWNSQGAMLESSTITVDNDDTLDSELASPDPGSTLEGGQIQFTQLQTWSDGCTVDTTASAGWTISTTTCDTSGSITSDGLYTAGQEPCSAGCSEDVSSSADNSPVTVTVNNDDTLQSELASPDPGSTLENGQIQFKQLQTYSDGCTVDTTASAGWTLSADSCANAASSINSDGLYTAGDELCGAGCGSSVASSADNSPVTVTVNNDDTIVSTNIEPGSTTVQENASTNFDLIRTWSDTCTEDLTADATWSISVSDCNTTGSVSGGLYTAGDEPGPAGCSESVVTSSPASDNTGDVTVTDDDAVAVEVTDISLHPDITSMSEGASVLFAATCTYSDSSTDDCTNAGGVSWSVTGDLTILSSTTLTAKVEANEIPCGDGGSGSLTGDAVDDPTVTDTLNITVDNDDTLQSELASPDPGSTLENGQIQFKQLQTYSDGCTVDTTASAGWTLSADSCANAASSINSDGLYTAGDELCGAGCGSSVASSADNSPVTVTVNNDDTIVSTNIEPGSTTVQENASTNFDLIRTWSDTCTEDLTADATWSISVSDCNTTGSVSGGLYTAGDEPGPAGCSESVVTSSPASDNTGDVTVTDDDGGAVAPVITAVFPIDTSITNRWGIDRYRLNAHHDQPLTVEVSNSPTSMSAGCTAEDLTNISYNCTDQGGGVWVCDTGGAFLVGGDTHYCKVTASNSSGSTVFYGDMLVAHDVADSYGGFAQGYIGGGTYDFTNNTAVPGNVLVTASRRELGSPIADNVYVQVIRGNTVSEYFTTTTGQLALTLTDRPIDELTLGYKCGLEQCPAEPPRSSANAADDYRYMTWHDIDARDMNCALKLMAGGFMRYRADVSGTIPEADFDTYIEDIQTDTAVGSIFHPPTRLRAAMVITTLWDTDQIAEGLDSIFYVPDKQGSISVCITGTGRDDARYPAKTALPPNLLAPEIIREDWNTPCDDWSVNPGITDFTMHFYDPGQYRVLWSIGLYANGGPFNLTVFDLYSFPFYTCALGWRGYTVPSGLSSGNQTDSVGTDLAWSNANGGIDLREDYTDTEGNNQKAESIYGDPWQEGDTRYTQQLGYDADGTYDRKVLMTLTSDLPIDPGRRDANMRSGATPSHTYKLPNISEETDIGGDFDQRFYRANQILLMGADLNVERGMGVTGLSLFNAHIDDVEFTTFQVFYMQSTGAPMMGNRDIQFWAGGNNPWGDAVGTPTDSLVVSKEHVNLASAWGEVSDTQGNTLNLTSRNQGGPTLYAGIFALSRGKHLYHRKDDRSMSGEVSFGQPDFHPGSVLSVYNMTEPENTTALEATDFMLMPEAIEPDPDQYLYPGIQWAGTAGESSPIQRNSEMIRDRTIETSETGRIIPSDGSRLYFKWTAKGVWKNSARDYDTWNVSLRESGIETVAADGSTYSGWRRKWSAVSKIESKYGRCSGSTFYDDPSTTDNWHYHAYRPYIGPMFQDQGVAGGDDLVINSRKHTCLDTTVTISSVDANNQLTLNTACADICGGLDGDHDIRYKVERKGTPLGECIINEWYGGGPGSYHCKANTFWEAEGPNIGSTVTVHLPEPASGSRTLSDGAGGNITAYVPDIWDGISPSQNVQLEWGYNTLVFNTSDYTTGGMGHAFMYSNRDFIENERTIEYNSSDSAYVLSQ